MDVTATDVDGQSVLHCAAGHEAARQSTLLQPSTPGQNLAGHEAPDDHEASGHVPLSTGGRDMMGDVVSALVVARANIHAQDARLDPRPTYHFHLAESDYKVVLQKSIPPQICQLILCYD